MPFCFGCQDFLALPFYCCEKTKKKKNTKKLQREELAGSLTSISLDRLSPWLHPRRRRLILDTTRLWSQLLFKILFSWKYHSFLYILMGLLKFWLAIGLKILALCRRNLVFLIAIKSKHAAGYDSIPRPIPILQLGIDTNINPLLSPLHQR